MRISENSSIILDPPVDINGAAVTTPWVNMEEGKDLSVVINTGVVGADFAVTLNQDILGDAAASKALAFTHYYVVDTTSGGDVPVKVEASSLTITTASDANKCFIIPVDASQLDVNNEFAFVRAALADPGAATIVGTNLILTKKRDVTASAST